MKNGVKILLWLLCITACENQNNFGDTAFVGHAAKSSDLKLNHTITTDNTGKVLFKPSGKGVLYYTLDFGDKSKISDKIKPGGTLEHTYREGNYKAILKAYNSLGKFTSKITDVNVKFKPPENVKVVAEADKTVAKKVQVTVTADFAVRYEVYFGEPKKDKPITGKIGEKVSYVYQNAGDYTLKIVVKGQAKATTTVTKKVKAIALLQPLLAAAPPPARDASKYLSIYGDSYTNIASVNTFPDWGQAGQGSNWGTYKIGNDNILKYGKLSYQGIQISSAGEDLSAMTHLHLDIWTPQAGVQIKIFLINKTPKGEKFVLKALSQGAWTSVNIPLSKYTSQGLSLKTIHQFKFEENARPWAKNDVFVDNIYFYKKETPSQSAPTPPARDTSKYLSIYGDSYTNIAGVNTFPDWGQAGQGSNWGTYKIDKDNILKYGKLSYQGIQISNAGEDISAMTHLHLDIWTPQAGVQIKIFLINKTTPKPNDEKFVLETLSQGAWTSVNIPLSKYTSQGLSLKTIHQFKFEESARPWAKNDVFIDNIYFYKN